jgi:hypothetical protein
VGLGDVGDEEEGLGGEQLDSFREVPEVHVCLVLGNGSVQATLNRLTVPHG